MDVSMQIAYAEVYTILNLMESKYIEKIPKEILYTLETQKDPNYNKKINTRKLLTEQNISKKALSILAVFNYAYWCENIEEKKCLVRKLVDNEIELRKKYNLDNIFKKKTNNSEKTTNETKTEIMLIPETTHIPLWKKIFNKINHFLKK